MKAGNWKLENRGQIEAARGSPDRQPHELDMRQASRPSVLLVDESEDSREVLKTALQRRGLDILEASRPAHGLALARQHQPRVVVLDLEIAQSAQRQLCEDFAQQASHDPPILVVIGTAGRAYPPPQNGSAEQVVSKPYHYGPLVRKIEQLVT
ncbi:MAG: response regulator [Planctomycetales bacterium]|nr:response regulator [Planctomycetales bacterium]NIM07960.1 response regulator [Planctomycetales bacterium]NIN07438.1 response regulator [Planctomycetales bacterium]NIN76542.1 response regulator [Planctomycetales bacterium]NIO33729.1 response regulator [Planctomycetales bacterium]